ncbi:MAG: hypothetical protein OXN21_04740 [Chloroflexota bacterium]|nr:hypothetical protein [Chloroflexota bacterium]
MDNLDDLKLEIESQIRHELNAGSEEATTILLRPDVLSILKLFSDSVQDDPIGLFWNLYEPTSSPSKEWDALILKVLEFFYRNHQVPYEPDGESLNENDVQYSLDAERLIIPKRVKALVTFLHVAAARGFRIKQSQGGQLSEEAINCFNEVVRTNQRLYQAGLGDLLDRDSSLMFLLSADAVSAKASVEIARVRLAEGNYEEALGCMASAAFESHYAVERYAEQGDDTDYRNESNPVPIAPSCSITDHMVRKGLDNTSPVEIASVFLKLKGYGQAARWLQVVKDCEHLFYSFYIFGAEENSYTRFQGGESEHITEWIAKQPEWVGSELGESLSWGEFWHGAKAWAAAQLSPSEYREMRQADEEGAAESRLKAYFFNESWASLSERCKERLIDADRIWNSPGNASWEAVLNDLRIAAEEVCQQFLWRQLLSNRGVSPALLSLLKKGIDVDGRPGVNECIQICRHPEFKQHLTQLRVDHVDREFLTNQLPAAMLRLRDNRNRAEHEAGDPWHRGQVRPIVDEFLGIGQIGILPRLVRIGLKLQRIVPSPSEE